MRNAKNADYLQIDNEIKKVKDRKGMVVLPSSVAFDRFKWARKYYKNKPDQGYFIWVREQQDAPLITCVTISMPGIKQSLQNLTIIEKGIKAKASVVCNVTHSNLCGTHLATGKLVLKENAGLEYFHVHEWGEDDFVNPEYEFFLEDGAKLTYNYKNLKPPKKLKLKTVIHTKKNSSANLNVVINGVNTKIHVHDIVYLEGSNANGIIRMRLVGKKDSEITALSTIVADAAGKGHLDCQGLLVDSGSTLTFTPELIDKNKDAIITHEASIGRIADEQLDYLKSRGLNEKEAIDLLISGFLGNNS